MNDRDTLKINSKGHLEIGGCDCTDLAKAFGTPLYVFDEAYIREMMRTYKTTIETSYGGNGKVLYASKAFSCEAMYAIAASEGIGVDPVSGGEIYASQKAGFPARDITFHGNNKLPEELSYALECGVGTIVLDSYLEADRLDEMAEKKGIVQEVLIRINPGVEAHTHAYVQTARIDSKFGFSIFDGEAEKMVSHVLSKKNLKLKGFHCHIGSQIFEKKSFCLAIEKVMDFAASVKKSQGFTIETLNIGGGFGVWYTDEDRKMKKEDFEEFLLAAIDTIKAKAAEHNLPEPYLNLEPGRSIVGEAGITLYTAGAIKDIPGVKKYVAIDGGMFDNPRFALYQSKYTVLLANRAAEEPCETVTIAGKCCESGDIIAENVPLPKVETGDIVAVLTTGAYNYSMASNNNRNLVPPAILVSDGEAEYIVKPQSYEDLVRNDVVPERLKK